MNPAEWRIPAVENFHKKIAGQRSNVIVKSVPFWEERVGFYRKWGTPLPLLPLKALTGAGFTKCVCKILSRKGLEVKILITKDLKPPLWLLADRFRLDHHRLSCLWIARSDVTMRRIDSGLLDASKLSELVYDCGVSSDKGGDVN
jgi:hypothetical protein